MLRWALFLTLLITPWNGEKIFKSQKEWLSFLGEEKFKILRGKGTEKAFLGKYVFSNDKGAYFCSGCKLALFSSKDKILVGKGFAHFSKPIFEKNVYYLEDFSMNFKRYEVLCSKCDGHLGHIFKYEEGYRYTINSLSLLFQVQN